MEQKQPIGQILKGLSKQRRIPVLELSSKLGITKQSVYETFNNRVSMSVEDMQKWATALEMNFQDLIAISTGGAGNVIEPPVRNFAGNDALSAIKRMLEDELREKNNEIREKNEQIKALQDALRESQRMATVLLGKSPEYRDGKVISNVFKWVGSKQEGTPVKTA